MTPGTHARPSGMGSFALGRLPAITFGAGSVASLPDAVSRHGRHVLVVASGSARARDGWNAIVTGLRDAGIEVHVAPAPAREPRPEDVDRIVGAARTADVVVAIGGGTALDTGKAVAGLVRAATSVADHLEGLPGRVAYAGPALPWIAVPTTAGTGSEVTRNAVLTTGGDDAAKRSFRDERLIAAEAIVAPDLLIGLRPEQIAGNGADAITQLLESYVSTRAMPPTDALALQGIALAGRALPAWLAAVRTGDDDPEARADMAYAALLSGICLANAGLGVVHGLVAPLGARTRAPHGAACGALLAAGVAANVLALEAGREGGSPTALGRYATLGRLLAGTREAAGDAAARAALVSWLAPFAAELALPRLAAWGLDAGIAREVARLARTSSSMRTNPVELTEDELVGVLERST